MGIKDAKRSNTVEVAFIDGSWHVSQPPHEWGSSHPTRREAANEAARISRECGYFILIENKTDDVVTLSQPRI